MAHSWHSGSFTIYKLLLPTFHGLVILFHILSPVLVDFLPVTAVFNVIVLKINSLLFQCSNEY